MAKDEKKGFFSAFRKRNPAGYEVSESKSQTPPAASVQNRNVTPESRVSSVSAKPPEPAVDQKPVAVQAQSDPVIDPVETFKVLCQSLVDIGTSQLKVAEMTLSMLSNSLNKIAEGTKPEKQD